MKNKTDSIPVVPTTATATATATAIVEDQVLRSINSFPGVKEGKIAVKW